MVTAALAFLAAASGATGLLTLLPPRKRTTGGDLARLLRESARGLEDQARLEGEVRAATAQARFTALIVVLLPFGGALLAELASPGWLAGLAGSFLTVWLVGLALGLQVIAAVLIHRLGRPAR